MEQSFSSLLSMILTLLLKIAFGAIRGNKCESQNHMRRVEAGRTKNLRAVPKRGQTADNEVKSQWGALTLIKSTCVRPAFNNVSPREGKEKNRFPYILTTNKLSFYWFLKIYLACATCLQRLPNKISKLFGEKTNVKNDQLAYL